MATNYRKHLWALLLAGIPGYLSAQTYTWNAPGSGSYHSAVNWTPSGPPSLTGEANFTSSNTYTVSFSQQNSMAKAFEVRGGNVTFRHTTTGASHSWTGGTAQNGTNFVAPRSTDAATSATLNLSNSVLSYQPMTMKRLNIGRSDKSGNLNVSNFRLNLTDYLTVGGSGNGVVNVNTNGRIDAAEVSISSTSSNPNAVMTVSGTNAQVNVGTSDFYYDLNVGTDGKGTLNISAGGRVKTQDSNAFIGRQAGSNGLVTVTGTGSRLDVLGADTALYVGKSSTIPGVGNGVLTIQTGGTVYTEKLLKMYDGATINLNGGTLSTEAIQRDGGNFNWTSGTLNFHKSKTIGSELLGIIGTTIGANRTLSTSPFMDMNLTASLTVNGKLASGYDLNNQGSHTLTIGSGGNVTAGNAINNYGTIHLSQSTSTISQGTVYNHGLLKGTGSINGSLFNQTAGEIQANSGNHLKFNGGLNWNYGTMQLLGGTLEFSKSVTNQAGATIGGHGTLITGTTLVAGATGLTNYGHLYFDSGNVSVAGKVEITGSGKVISNLGYTTTFQNDVVHNGIEIYTGPGSTTIFQGLFCGAGPMTGTGNVIYQGGFCPGNSPADVSLAGNVTFSATSKLEIELGGLNPGEEYDRLTTQGKFYINNAMLDVALLHDFIPEAGEAFLIVNNLGSEAIQGRFLNLEEGTEFLSGGQRYSISYFAGDGNDIQLTARGFQFTSVPELTTWVLIGLTGALTGGYGLWRRRAARNQLLA